MPQGIAAVGGLRLVLLQAEGRIQRAQFQQQRSCLCLGLGLLGTFVGTTSSSIFFGCLFRNLPEVICAQCRVFCHGNPALMRAAGSAGGKIGGEACRVGLAFGVDLVAI
mmetsp:Transcript_7326/g.19683  ORF Transcript_7326/g.19683 Transcript_7326/m.19683 type:complete len:109 (+) Transcript_7326:1278-1604(+)